MKKFILTIMIAFAIGCSESTETKNYLTGVIIQKQGNVFVNDTNVDIGTKIKKEDVIKTDNKSYAVIEIPDMGKVTLKPNSKISFHTYSETSAEIIQDKGTTFSKIDRKGANYKIITPTTVAGVRGTTFEVTYTGNKTSIKLLEGKVAAYRKNGGVESPTVVLEENQKLEMTDNVISEVKPITKTEIAMLEKEVKVIDNKVVEPQAKITAPKLTLADIKAKFGRLSIVTLKDGSVYKGTFTQSGAIMTIITPHGTFKVHSSKIANVKPLE